MKTKILCLVCVSKRGGASGAEEKVSCLCGNCDSADMDGKIRSCTFVASDKTKMDTSLLFACCNHTAQKPRPAKGISILSFLSEKKGVESSSQSNTTRVANVRARTHRHHRAT